MKLVNLGNGGLDLESIVNKEKNNPLRVVGNSVRMPLHVVARDRYKDRFYYGKIKIKEEEKNGNLVTLALDSKNDLDDFASFKTEQELEDHLKRLGITSQDQRLELDVGETNPGQGALNAAYGESVFLQGNDLLDIFLVSTYYNEEVKNALPKNMIYAPVCQGTCPAAQETDCDAKDAIATNINIKLQGKKITFKTPVKDYCGLNESGVVEGLEEEDALFIDSVKDNGLLTLALESIIKNNPHVYVSPTKSMVEKAGHSSVWRMLSHSEVYSAGLDELEFLTGKTISQYEDEEDDYVKRRKIFYDELKKRMSFVQSRMKKGARVYVTDDDRGAYLLDENGDLYHHPVARDIDPRLSSTINTSGCGDAFAAIVSILELARSNNKSQYSTAEIFGYAGIAGQINAFNKTTCGPKMATPEKIDDYLKENPDAKTVKKYNGSKFEQAVELTDMK